MGLILRDLECVNDANRNRPKCETDRGLPSCFTLRTNTKRTRYGVRFRNLLGELTGQRFDWSRGTILPYQSGTYRPE